MHLFDDCKLVALLYIQCIWFHVTFILSFIQNGSFFRKRYDNLKLKSTIVTAIYDVTGVVIGGDYHLVRSVNV